MRERLTAMLQSLLDLLGLFRALREVVPELSESDLMHDLNYGRD